MSAAGGGLLVALDATAYADELIDWPTEDREDHTQAACVGSTLAIEFNAPYNTRSPSFIRMVSPALHNPALTAGILGNATSQM
ncbi:MAG: hypothetical protein AAF547_20920 [Actinomycetota bacterium]